MTCYLLCRRHARVHSERRFACPVSYQFFSDGEFHLRQTQLEPRADADKNGARFDFRRRRRTIPQ